jgi:DNA-binding beta-propeller fold protein YncE
LQPWTTAADEPIGLVNPPRATGEGFSTARTLTAAALALSVGTTAGSAVAEPLPLRVITGRDISVPFHQLGGVAVDRKTREILVADGGRGEVVAFDTTGIARGRFVHRVPGPEGGLVDGAPNWLAVDVHGHLLISDLRAGYVDVVDLRGRSVDRLSVEGVELGDGPGALAVGPDGTIFVAARGQAGRIHVFDAEHRHIISWGTAGADSGRLSAITALAVTPSGQLVVACAMTESSVQVFEPRGRLIRAFGAHDTGPGNFSQPSGAAVTDDGTLWVADEVRQTVQYFDPAGMYVGMLGGFGSRLGEFRFPRALATDGQGLLVVAERGGNRVQLWRIP